MIIRVEKVNKHFLLNGRRILVLDNVTLTVGAGEFVALLGPSGCGKSTLLSLLAGYFPPDDGLIELTGRLGYMPQRDMLLPWLNVVENACLPVAVRQAAALPAARDEVRNLLPLFGLEGFGGSLPGQLSGGMRQRAALLRTYMAGGDFWLLDEPFGNLDTLTKEALQEWFMELRKEIKTGVLFVTHDIAEAVKLAGRIYALSPRPGRVIGEWRVAAATSPGEREQLKQEILASLGAKKETSL
ncbi:MAG: ATP-binding cassette domain-containing protein [Clostridiales bacterium]|nr:ATP-binding cassette domain-containing protein [Clostridiales bacterium]